MKFIINYFNAYTKDMRTWFKWSFGLVTFIPAIAIMFLIAFPVFVIGFGLAKIGFFEKTDKAILLFKNLFFREEK